MAWHRQHQLGLVLAGCSSAVALSDIQTAQGWLSGGLVGGCLLTGLLVMVLLMCIKRSKKLKAPAEAENGTSDKPAHYPGPLGDLYTSPGIQRKRRSSKKTASVVGTSFKKNKEEESALYSTVDDEVIVKINGAAVKPPIAPKPTNYKKSFDDSSNEKVLNQEEPRPVAHTNEAKAVNTDSNLYDYAVFEGIVETVPEAVSDGKLDTVPDTIEENAYELVT